MTIPSVGDLYQSKKGKGRDLARVVAILPTEIVLVHIGKDGNDRRSFSLPLRFFMGDSCGWALADTEPTVKQ